MNFEAIKAALTAMTHKQSTLLADEAKVARGTLAKIRYGVTTSPRICTVEKLAAALQKPS